MPDFSDPTSSSDPSLFPSPGEIVPNLARRASWESCFDSWLAGYTNPAARRKFRRAVEHCLFTLHKPPWALTSDDVASYLQTGLGNLSLNTRYFYLKALRAFYRHALTFTGMDGSLIDHNPAQNVTIPIPRLFVKSHALSEDELRRLFTAIDREKPIGSRDYALYLVVLSTGLKAAQALKLRLGVLKIERGNAWIFVPGQTGASARLIRLPRPVIEAILVYLGLSGKAARFQPDDPLFTPLQDLMGFLEQEHKSDWDRRPLSREKADEYLRRYAGWAGLEKERVTLESLRATGALLRLRQGASLRDLADFLDLGHTHQAARFLRQIQDQLAAQSWLKDSPAYSWLKDHGRYSRLKDFPTSTDPPDRLEERVERVLRERILPPTDQPSRSKRRPPCLPSIRTRSFWKALSEPATTEELDDARLVESLDDEIALMRVSTRRMFEAIPDDAPPLEAIKCLGAIGLMCSRIGRLSLINHKMNRTKSIRSTCVILQALYAEFKLTRE